jgi:hypothetical protein
MQIQRFNNGGFVLHKIKLFGYCMSRFSAWYDKNGKIIDAERIDENHKEHEVSRFTDTWRDLVKLGLTNTAKAV